MMAFIGFSERGVGAVVPGHESNGHAQGVDGGLKLCSGNRQLSDRVPGESVARVEAQGGLIAIGSFLCSILDSGLVSVLLLSAGLRAE
jgi:hypothetical protein